MAAPGGKNLLDMIPSRNPRFAWQLGGDGRVQIRLPRDGLLERLVRRLAKTPAALTVDLDDLGSFVWQAMDGRRDIHAIGALVRAEFGEGAEPLYQRLAGFMRLLEGNRLIQCRYPAKKGAGTQATPGDH